MYTCTKEFIEEVMESYDASMKAIDNIDDFDYFVVSEAATDTKTVTPADVANQNKPNNTNTQGNTSDNKLNSPKNDTKSELFSVVKNKIKINIAKIFEEIKFILNKITTKIKKYMNMYVQSSAKWRKELKEWQAKTKPADSMEFVTYTYNLNLLEQIYNRMTNFFGTASKQLLSDAQHIHDTGNTEGITHTLKATEFMSRARKTILPEAKKDMQTTAGFINQIVELVKGEKKTIIYKKEQLPRLIALSDTFDGTKRKTDGLIREAGNIDKAVTTLQRSYNLDPKSDAAIGKKALNIGKTMARLRSMYSAVIRIYLSLNYEVQVNYRLIIRRMYGA